MLIFFGILIVIACILLGFFVLVQNPKGGGLAGNLGGFGNQVMGVRQTTDVLEKGTWILAAVIAVLCLTSTMFIGAGTATNDMPQSASERSQGAAPVAPPAGNTTTLPGAAQQAPAAPADTNK
ncbi:preprotein translocase subunit SecG [Chitinophaga deserti]|uniref:preprotein translocase subunit SecG n=1 Tax=Chitinophaga deserti TaxID=2164099 RepID=UPI000D6C62B4|nr:preprotein translocase subunit SecG [Chitinophaga deserti]